MTMARAVDPLQTFLSSLPAEVKEGDAPITLRHAEVRAQFGLTRHHTQFAFGVMEALLMIQPEGKNEFVYIGSRFLPDLLTLLSRMTEPAGIEKALACQRSAKILQWRAGQAGGGNSGIVGDHPGVPLKNNNNVKKTVIIERTHQVLMAFMGSCSPHLMDVLLLTHTLFGRQSLRSHNSHEYHNIFGITKVLRLLPKPLLRHMLYPRVLTDTRLTLQPLFPCGNAAPPLTDAMLDRLPCIRGVPVMTFVCPGLLVMSDSSSVVFVEQGVAVGEVVEDELSEDEAEEGMEAEQDVLFVVVWDESENK